MLRILQQLIEKYNITLAGIAFDMVLSNIEHKVMFQVKQAVLHAIMKSILPAKLFWTHIMHAKFFEIVLLPAKQQVWTPLVKGYDSRIRCERSRASPIIFGCKPLYNIFENKNNKFETLFWSNIWYFLRCVPWKKNERRIDKSVLENLISFINTIRDI